MRVYIEVVQTANEYHEKVIVFTNIEDAQHYENKTYLRNKKLESDVHEIIIEDDDNNIIIEIDP